MTSSERRAVTRDDVTYAPGARFRVIRAGVTLDGIVPEQGGYGDWQQHLQPGDVVTCTGYGPGWGADPGYGIEFTSAGSEAARAIHCKIRPMTGGLFDYRPAPGSLQAEDTPAAAASQRAPGGKQAPATYDIMCTAQTLRDAAAWAARWPRHDITLERYGSELAVRVGAHPNPERFPAGGPPGSRHEIVITPDQLAAAAAWAETGEDMAEVTLLADDTMLLVTQGDDRTAFDTDGSIGSDEYLELAPLDRP
jgi:hypothetical protein